MYEMLVDLITASTKKDKERAYARLERVGVDRMTANVLAKEIYNEWEENHNDV